LSIPRSVTDDPRRRAARNSLLARRATITADARRIADAAMVARLDEKIAVHRRRSALVLGAYWPVRGEPDLRDALARWHDGGWTIALPRVVAAGRSLEFGRWAPGWSMRDAQFGIPVPEPFEPLRPTLLLVPCVGFDARCYRLGYGGGYYDRTLEAHAVATIGVAYDSCEIEAFRPGAHDRRLDAIVTQTRCLVAG